MLILNTLEKKPLEFEVQIEGIDHTQLQGFLRFRINEVEYGFPAQIHEDHINVIIPEFNRISKLKFKNGDIIEGRLEVFGNGFFLESWSGEFKVDSPLQVEAKLVKSTGDIVSEDEEPEDKAPISVKAVREITEEKEEVAVEDNDDIMESRIRELIQKELAQEETESPHSEELEIIQEPDEPEEQEDKEKEEEPLDDEEEEEIKSQGYMQQNESKEDRQKVVQTKVSDILERYMFKTKTEQTHTPKPAPKPKTKQIPKKVTAESVKKVLKKTSPKKKSIRTVQEVLKDHIVAEDETNKTMDDIYALMESKGMKSKRIQNSIIEKAKSMGSNPESIYHCVSAMLTPPTQQ